MREQNQIQELSERLARMRVVTMNIFFNAAAPDHLRAETGKNHVSVISPNFIVFPPVVDTLEDGKLEDIRKIWLKSNAEKAMGAAPVFNEGITEKFERLLSEALSPTPAKSSVEDAFIRAAKYPVPSDYALVLPEEPKSLRREIIDALVPFRKTAESLFRLEQTLELPMRAVVIGHTRAASTDELKASIASPRLN